MKTPFAIFEVSMSILATLAFLSIVAVECRLDPPYPGPVRGTIRDLVIGAGAAGMTVRFYKFQNDEWVLWTTNTTDSGGNIRALIHPDDYTDTLYKFVYYHVPYYTALGYTTFYAYIEIVFEKPDNGILLIPVGMSPYGYSAYRGNVLS